MGEYFTYENIRWRDASQTQHRESSANPDSYSRFDSALYVSDPIVDYFGMVELTYGFCSPSTREAHPRARISPGLSTSTPSRGIAREMHLSTPRAAIDFSYRTKTCSRSPNGCNEYAVRPPILHGTRPHIKVTPEHKREFVEMLERGGRRDSSSSLSTHFP